MEVVIKYSCGTCHHLWDTPDQAHFCEQRESPPLNFHFGNRLESPDGSIIYDIQEMKIVLHKIGRNTLKHIRKYLVQITEVGSTIEKWETDTFLVNLIKRQGYKFTNP